MSVDVTDNHFSGDFFHLDEEDQDDKLVLGIGLLGKLAGIWFEAS